MTNHNRQSTGVAGLDEKLGGGLLPGVLTVVVGATGIGKTQLGLQYANAGASQEGNRGVIFDVSARGDSQSHSGYAQRMFDWPLVETFSGEAFDGKTFFDTIGTHGDYYHVFDYRGRRVTRSDLDWDEWRNWQAELNQKLRSAIAFLYGSLIGGVRRVVVDGVEPVDRPNESIQLNLFEYVYHQILRKESEWVARDLLRENYRRLADQAAKYSYDASDASCMLLYTSHETMLEDLISRPLDEGDALSNANTLIFMGKIRDGDHIRRGLYIAKHRGSACSEQILPYEIDDQGVRLI